MTKGAGVTPHPFFISIVLLYQFQPTYPANFPDFIFLANSSTYTGNRRNGGLTRFFQNRDMRSPVISRIALMRDGEVISGRSSRRHPLWPGGAPGAPLYG